MVAWARLAELEAGFTIEQAKVEALKARLFARLRDRCGNGGAGGEAGTLRSLVR